MSTSVTSAWLSWGVASSRDRSSSATAASCSACTFFSSGAFLASSAASLLIWMSEAIWAVSNVVYDAAGWSASPSSRRTTAIRWRTARAVKSWSVWASARYSSSAEASWPRAVVEMMAGPPPFGVTMVDSASDWSTRAR